MSATPPKLPPSEDVCPVSGPYSDELGDNAGYLLSRVKSLMTNMVTQRTQTELGITGSQASLLFMISIGRCSTAAELARHQGIDASAITRLLDRIEKHGLLRRVRSSEDRRVVRLELTDAGHDTATRLPEIYRSVLDEVFSGFTAEEMDFFKIVLRRIILNHGECSMMLPNPPGHH